MNHAHSTSLLGVCAAAALAAPATDAQAQVVSPDIRFDVENIEPETAQIIDLAYQTFMNMDRGDARNADGDDFALATTFVTGDAARGGFAFLDTVPDNFVINALMQDAGLHEATEARILVGAGEIDIPTGMVGPIDLPEGLKLILVGMRAEDLSNLAVLPGLGDPDARGGGPGADQRITFHLGIDAALERSGLSPQEALIEWTGSDATLLLAAIAGIDTSGKPEDIEDIIRFFGLSIPVEPISGIGASFDVDIDTAPARGDAPFAFNVVIAAFVVQEDEIAVEAVPAASFAWLAALGISVLAAGGVGAARAARRRSDKHS